MSTPKKRKRDWVGEHVRVTRPIRTGEHTVPPGSYAVVESTYRGKFGIRTKGCACCGVAVTATAVPEYCLQVVPALGEDVVTVFRVVDPGRAVNDYIARTTEDVADFIRGQMDMGDADPGDVYRIVVERWNRADVDALPEWEA